MYIRYYPTVRWKRRRPDVVGQTDERCGQILSRLMDRLRRGNGAGGICALNGLLLLWTGQ